MPLLLPLPKISHASTTTTTDNPNSSIHTLLGTKYTTPHLLLCFGSKGLPIIGLFRCLNFLLLGAEFALE